MNRREAALLLGVPNDASVDDIDLAFRRVSRLTHPDCGGSPAAFGSLVTARHVLTTTTATTTTTRPAAVSFVPRSSLTRRSWHRRRRQLLRRIGWPTPPRVE